MAVPDATPVIDPAALLRFVLFGILFFAIASAHFAAAIWVCRRLHIVGAGRIDTDYLRVENFEAIAVRTGGLTSEPQRAGFTSKVDSQFERVIHVLGDCTLSRGTRVRGVVAEGLLFLREGVEVEEFADSGAALVLAKNNRVGGRVTASDSITLGPSVRARSFFAREIRTMGTFTKPLEPGSHRISLAFDGSDDGMRPMGDDTWICMRSIDARAPLSLDRKLVVLGSFSVPAGSELLQDVKAEGDISIGAGSFCHGNLVSEASITLGEGSHFAGVLHAGRDIYLERGVRGEGKGRTVAWAARRVVLAQDVLVRGKIAAGREVVTKG
jgi:hypothetical protein